MEWSAVWFFLTLGLGALAWAGGCHVARHSPARGRLVAAVGVLCLLAWSGLQRHPAISVRLFPVEMLSILEGIGGVPLFLMICGIAWAMAVHHAQRRLIIAAAVLGGVVMLQGGMWMLQVTPAQALGVEASPDIRQSQEWSCVPAATATALNHLGIRATESEMATLTHARPGTGSTTIRALHALRQKLQATAIQPELVQVPAGDLLGMRLPAVTPLQFETTQRHMVVLKSVGQDGVHMHDPMYGSIHMTLHDFTAVYRNELIVFVRP